MSWNVKWTKERRSALSKARLGSGNPMFGRKKSKEATEKQKRAVSGSNHYRWNPDREEVARKKKQRAVMYSLLWRVLGRSSLKKDGLTEELLCYTKDDLCRHLETLFEDGMTWKNHGSKPGCWQIDHIHPVNQFPIDASPKEVNALLNLRPLWMYENLHRARKARR